MSDPARLLAAIREAHRDGRLAIAVDLGAVSRAGSPSYRTTDIVVPWFCLLVIAVYVAVEFMVEAGVALFVVGAAMILALVRPYNRRRAIGRTIAMGLASAEHWQTFWDLGGLMLETRTGARCASPDGDWRSFARGLEEAARS